jgi:hypothetical protein
MAMRTVALALLAFCVLGASGDAAHDCASAQAAASIPEVVKARVRVKEMAVRVAGQDQDGVYLQPVTQSELWVEAEKTATMLTTGQIITCGVVEVEHTAASRPRFSIVFDCGLQGKFKYRGLRF